MSDLDATTPRVFLGRHGETEWTISGQQTGTSDIPLTARGERQVTSTGALLVGPGKLLDPKAVRGVWVSPRQRAMRTFQLLFGGGGQIAQPANTAAGRSSQGGGGVGEEEERVPKEVAGVREAIFGGGEGSVVVTEEIREWDYGEYEGMKAADVRELRKQRGLDREGAPQWSVWRDGCEGGESKQDVETRLDHLINEIRELQRPYMNGEGVGDVVLVAHGLILRCFVKRWLRLSVDDPLPMMMAPGALAILSYKNHDVNQPAFFVGMACDTHAN